MPDVRRVLARAGCPPDSGQDFLAVAERAIHMLSEIASPATFSTELMVIAFSDEWIETEGFTIVSRDMARKLRGAEKLSLFLATIGPGPEEVCCALFEESKFSEALALDAAASEMAELLLRRAHMEAAALMRGFAGTARYAPGYGDFSLSHQARIVNLLGGDETGVRVMEDSFMLVPKKSTTGVVGWKRPEN